MGRRSHTRRLGLWMNGALVGHWSLAPNAPDKLQYDAHWIASPQGRPLSLSLPFMPGNPPLRGPQVRAYFENLLPDSKEIRERLARRFHTGSTAAFDLLSEIGRDCVGALEILPDGQSSSGPGPLQAQALSEAQVAQWLRGTTSPATLAGADEQELRISIAGAQEKTALLLHQGRWCLPQGSTPTTHIFKLPLGLVGGRQADFSTSVDNEWLCLKLLAAYGLPVPEAEIASFGQQRVLVVERFDRVVSADGQRLLRLVQEDFCQATGTSPLVKYEAEGGPGLDLLFNLLQQSVDAERDLRTLMASQLLFWMLRAPDGHAKNFSIQLLPGGRYRLTPLYDVMSAYPVMGDGPNQWSPRELKLAMALVGKNRHYEVERIQRRHFNSTAKRFGYGETAEPLIQELIERTPVVIDEVQRALTPGFSDEVAVKVLSGLRTAARVLEVMPAD